MNRVLLDHCVPRPLGNLLVNCEVSTAQQMGWSQLKNGELLNAAEAAQFAALITADKSLRYQQNLTVRQISIIEVPTNRLRLIVNYAAQVNAILATLLPGSYHVIPT